MVISTKIFANFGEIMYLYREPFPAVKITAGKVLAVLEAGLANSGDLTLVGQLSEANTADAVVTKVSVGTAAYLAAVVLTSRELGRSLLL